MEDLAKEIVVAEKGEERLTGRMADGKVEVDFQETANRNED